MRINELAAAPARKLLDSLGGHRACHVVALGDVTTDVAQPVQRLGILDTLGDDAQSKVVAQLDRGANDDRVVALGRHVHDERLVDLELVDLEPLQVRQ